MRSLKDNIKAFVKHTLGCQCPEEVFERIEHEQDVRLGNDTVLSSRINIGNRLLIYIIDPPDEYSIVNNLESIVSLGKEERDRRGFNRFRLVVITENAAGLREDAHIEFNEMQGNDDKVHLHVVEKAL